MTLLPKVKLKAVVNFPAHILDGTGIDVVKSNGTYQFDLAFSDFAPPVGSVTDAAHQNALLWNSVTGSYTLAPMALLSGGSLPEAPNTGLQYGRQSLGWTQIVIPAVPTPSATFPVMDGTAIPGVATAYSRGDHVHPTDTSRAPAVFVQAGTDAVNRTPQDKMRERVSVADFSGVDPTGVADSTAGIQAAINSLTSGAELFFPPGTYKISSSLHIGDGSSVQASTRWSIHLVGGGTPPLPAGFFAGYPATGGVKILWAGGAASMITINGPLNGWGVSNMYIDGASLSTIGIENISASFGQCHNLAITNCKAAAISEATLSTFTGFATSSAIHNSYTNIAINVPSIANATAIVLSGQPAGVSGATNSCYGHFQNVVICQPPALATFGVYLQWTDSVVFDGLHIFGGSATSVAVQFDYTASNNMPSGCQFNGLDISGSGSSTQFAIAGAPGSGARPNYINGISEINLGTQPNIANLAPDLPRQHGFTNLTGQTGALTNVALFTPFATGLYRVAYYIVMTTGGSGGTLTVVVNFNDGFGARTLSSIAINANGAAPALTGGVVSFRAVASAVISYSVTFTGVTGSPAYAVTLSVERIG